MAKRARVRRPGLTVRELAEKVQRPDQDLNAVVVRLRNWTKEGFLMPSGDKSPGTGHRRRYPETAVLEALILNFLTDVVEIRTVALKPFLDDLRADPRWALAIGFPADRFLIIGRTSASTDFEVHIKPFKKVAAHLKASKMEAHVVVSLAALLAPLSRD